MDKSFVNNISEICKIIFIILGIIIALIKLLIEIISEEQKNQLLLKVERIKNWLEKFDLKKLIASIKNKWLLIFFEYLAYLVFIFTIIFFAKKWGNNTFEFNFIKNDEYLSFTINIIRNFISYLKDNIYAIYFIAFIYLVTRRFLFTDEKDYQKIEHIIDNGSYLEFIEKFIKNLFEIIFYALFFYGCYYLIIHPEISKNSTFLNILTFLAYVYIITLPFIVHNIIYRIAVFWFALLLITLIWINYFLVISLKKIVILIHSNPNKFWAVFLAIIGIITALKQI